MAQEKGTDQFHDSESEDIYDLYNACNGALDGDLLDVRKLDELSREESEALDVARLREIWEHTKSGCAKCKAIITTLNAARGLLLRESDEERSPEQSQAVDGSPFDSI